MQNLTKQMGCASVSVFTHFIFLNLVQDRIESEALYVITHSLQRFSAKVTVAIILRKMDSRPFEFKIVD